MTQESIANQPISAEGKEKIFSPEKTAERLYQLGFRLSAPLETPLMDTGNEIVLSNVYAPYYLTKTWADGVDRRVEQFYQFLGITEDEEIADWLWQKSSEKREPDPAGKEELAKFLIEKQPRQAWGELNCYLALAESGNQPWQWIPEEMISKIVSEIKTDGLRGFFFRKNVVGWIVPQKEIAQEIVRRLLTNSNHYFSRIDEERRITTLISEFDDRYPEQTEEIVIEIENQPPAMIPIFPYTYLLGPETIKRLAEKMYPKRETKYYDWLRYQEVLFHKEFTAQKDGSLRSRDGKIVIPPPRPVFLTVRGSVEFQTKERIAEDLEETKKMIERTKEELNKLEKHRKILESLG